MALLPPRSPGSDPCCGTSRDWARDEGHTVAWRAVYGWKVVQGSIIRSIWSPRIVQQVCFRQALIHHIQAVSIWYKFWYLQRVWRAGEYRVVFWQRLGNARSTVAQVYTVQRLLGDFWSLIQSRLNQGPGQHRPWYATPHSICFCTPGSRLPEGGGIFIL